jgi:hypothetical protein
MQWFAAHVTQITALICAELLVGLANKGVPKITRSGKEHGKKFARWATFAIMVLAGLCRAVGMVPVVGWLTGLGTAGGFGAAVGNIGAIVTLAFGWHGVAMAISVARDLADGVPDEEARKGALWIPTLLPAGAAAVVGLLQNPQGLGRGITAAIMGLITLVYVFMIVKRALAAQKHQTFWLWFAFVISLVGGLVMVPLIAYMDTAIVQGFLPGALQAAVRVIAGVFGVCAIGAGIWDIVCDGVPNKYARAAATYGLGLTFVFGGLAIAAISGNATDGASMLNGVL